MDNDASLVARLVNNPPAMQETPGSIPGSGSSPGEGLGYPPQYSWASLVARIVKKKKKKKIRLQCGRPGFDPCVWEDPLEECMAIHSSILVWKFSLTEAAWGQKESGRTE